MSSLPKTVTRQRRGCDLNQGPSAPESSTLTTRLPSHLFKVANIIACLLLVVTVISFFSFFCVLLSVSVCALLRVL